MNYKTQRYSLWGLLLLASTLSVNAAPRSKAAMERAAKAILTQKAIGSSARTAPTKGQFRSFSNTILSRPTNKEGRRRGGPAY